MPLNIDSMQQEAMRRVQEMHSRTHSAAPRRAAAPPPAPSPDVHPEAPPVETVPQASEAVPIQHIPPAPNEVRAPVPETPSGGGQNLLDTVFHDKERSLIMLLILILANDNTNPEALLALMYLVM